MTTRTFQARKPDALVTEVRTYTFDVFGGPRMSFRVRGVRGVNAWSTVATNSESDALALASRLIGYDVTEEGDGH